LLPPLELLLLPLLDDQLEEPLDQSDPPVDQLLEVDASS
jgi:hypothetical protein